MTKASIGIEVNASDATRNVEKLNSAFVEMDKNIGKLTKELVDVFDSISKFSTNKFSPFSDSDVKKTKSELESIKKTVDSFSGSLSDLTVDTKPINSLINSINSLSKDKNTPESFKSSSTALVEILNQLKTLSQKATSRISTNPSSAYSNKDITDPIDNVMTSISTLNSKFKELDGMIADIQYQKVEKAVNNIIEISNGLGKMTLSGEFGVNYSPLSHNETENYAAMSKIITDGVIAGAGAIGKGIIAGAGLTAKGVSALEQGVGTRLFAINQKTPTVAELATTGVSAIGKGFTKGVSALEQGIGTRLFAINQKDLSGTGHGALSNTTRNNIISESDILSGDIQAIQKSSIKAFGSSIDDLRMGVVNAAVGISNFNEKLKEVNGKTAQNISQFVTEKLSSGVEGLKFFASTHSVEALKDTKRYAAYWNDPTHQSQSSRENEERAYKAWLSDPTRKFRSGYTTKEATDIEQQRTESILKNANAQLKARPIIEKLGNASIVAIQKLGDFEEKFKPFSDLLGKAGQAIAGASKTVWNALGSVGNIFHKPKTSTSNDNTVPPGSDSTEQAKSEGKKDGESYSEGFEAGKEEGKRKKKQQEHKSHHKNSEYEYSEDDEEEGSKKEEGFTFHTDGRRVYSFTAGNFSGAFENPDEDIAEQVRRLMEKLQNHEEILMENDERRARASENNSIARMTESEVAKATVDTRNLHTSILALERVLDLGNNDVTNRGKIGAYFNQMGSVGLTGLPGFLYSGFNAKLIKNTNRKSMKKFMFDTETYKKWQESNPLADNKDFFGNKKLMAASVQELTKKAQSDPDFLKSLTKSGNMLSTALGLATKGLVDFGKYVARAGKEAFEAFEKIQQLQTQLSVVYGSQAESNKAFSEIEAYAKKSPFGVETMTQQAILLKQSGVYGSELMDTMARIGDMASGNAHKMKSISEVYARILSSTTVTARDMRQLSNAGVPSYRALTKSLAQIGDSERNIRDLPSDIQQSQVRSMLQGGKITSQDFERMIKILTDKGGTFYGAVNKGAQTIAARKQNLEDAKEMARASIGEVLATFGGIDTNTSLYGKFITLLENIYSTEEKFFTNWNIKNKMSSGVTRQEENLGAALIKDEEIAGIIYSLTGQGAAAYKEAREKELSNEALAYDVEFEKITNSLTDDQIKKLEEYKEKLIESSIEPGNKLEELKKVVENTGLDVDTAETRQYKDLIKQINELTQQVKLIDDTITEYRLSKEDERYIRYEAGSYRYGKLSSLLDANGTYASDAGDKIITDANSVVNRIIKATSSYDASAFGTMLKSDKAYYRDLDLKKEIEEAVKLVNPQYNPETGNYSIALSNTSNIGDYIRVRDLLTSSTPEAMKMGDEDLFINGRITEEGAQTLSDFKDNLVEFAIVASNFKNVIPEATDEVGKMLSLLRQDTFTPEDYRLLAESSEAYKEIISSAAYMGKISAKDAENLKEGFLGTFAYRQYDTSNAKNLGKRLSPSLRDSILASFIGFDANRVKEIGAGNAFSKYASNLSKRNEFKTVAKSLLSSGVELGTLSSLMKRTGKGYDGTQLFDWGTTSANIEDLASKHSIETQQALISAYEQQIDTLNELEVSGVATADQWNELHNASDILGSGFSLAATRMADGSYKFEEAAIQAAEAMKKEYSAKLFREKNNLLIRQTAEDIVNNTRKTGIENILLSGQMSVGSSYVSTDNIGKVSGVIDSLISTNKGKWTNGFAGLSSVDEAEVALLVNKLFGADSLYTVKNPKVEKISGGDDGLFLDMVNFYNGYKKNVELLQKQYPGYNFNFDSNGKLTSYDKVVSGSKTLNVTEDQLGSLFSDLSSLSPEKQVAALRLIELLTGTVEGLAELTTTISTDFDAGQLNKRLLEIRKINETISSFGSETGFNNSKQASFVDVDKNSHLYSFYNTDAVKNILSAAGMSENLNILKGFNELGQVQASSLVFNSEYSSNKSIYDIMANSLSKNPAIALKNLSGTDKTKLLSDTGLTEDFSALLNEDGSTNMEKIVLLAQSLVDILGEAGLGNLLGDMNLMQASTEAISKEWDNFASSSVDALLNGALNGYTNITKKLGENWYNISNSIITSDEASKEMGKAWRDIGSEILGTVSSTAITAGLNIASSAALSQQWGLVAAGLGLAAAGGFGNVATGFLDAMNNENKTDDQVAKLEKLKNNLADLLEQARNDASYFETALRTGSSIAANDSLSSLYATKVNDMILTDKGVFSTDPKDTIMAMKDPTSLVSGGTMNFSPNITLKMVNESGTTIGVRDVKSSVTSGGDIDITAIIDSTVKKGFADGSYDEAIEAMSSRQRGRVVSA